MVKKVWFVTSASTGFGRAVTEYALQQGDSVVAALREPDALSDLSKYSSQLLVLSLDVTVLEHIPAAFKHAFERFGRIDVVFNNAELRIFGEAEGMSDKHGREMFEVLFWGATNVSKEAVKVFRERNDPPGGLLLQVSSQTALKPVAGIAHYAAAKTAFECLSQGLAAELDPSWNIKISVVQPALFRMNTHWANFVNPIHPAYTDRHFPSKRVRDLLPGEPTPQVCGGDPKKFAQAMHQLAYMDDPPPYLPLHRVALQTAKTKGEELVRTAKEYAAWSDDVYSHTGQN